MKLTVPTWCAIVAFIVTVVFLLYQSPYTMALFAFFAQPLFLIAAVLYLRNVFVELKKKDVL